MREPLRPYRGPDVLNFLCIVASEFLGHTSLRDFPSLLSGFDSIVLSLEPKLRRALRNLRLAGIAPVTLRELRLMVESYRAHHARIEQERGDHHSDRGPREISARFIVDNDLSFRARWTSIVPDDVIEASHCLTEELPLRVAAPVRLHDPTHGADVKSQFGRYEGYIEALDFSPPPPERYDLARVGRAPGFLPWSDLISQAEKFDHIDELRGRQEAGARLWYGRLHDCRGEATAVLLKASPAGLVRSEGLDLFDVKHLIGLPGAGKTTLLYLLAACLAERGKRVCFLFPSIEVATAFLEKLALYDVSVGLLSGQGDTTRNRHVLNFSAALSAESCGYGVTRAGAPFFATTCALGGYASEEEEPFPHVTPPCTGLMQRPVTGGVSRPHQCALSSVCGRQYSERTLISANVWAGHVLSMDRSVSKLYTDTRLRHFEFIARTFDLIVVDECDGAQGVLDARGTPTTKLSGDSDSVWDTLIHDLHGKAARGRNAFVAGLSVPYLLEMTGRFGRATERLTARIMHLDRKFRDRNANLLLTSLSLIADMYAYDGDSDEEDSRQRDARNGLERVWDAAAKHVAFRHAVPEDEDDELEGAGAQERDLAQAAILLGISDEETLGIYGQLRDGLDKWDRDGNESAIREIAKALKSIPTLQSPHSDEIFFSYTSLLTTVLLLVLQHFGLAPHLRLMNSEGLVSDGVFESRLSKDQLAILPESLAGRLSGVRYTVSDEGNVDIAQVSFSGTPRLLFHRMLALGREVGSEPAVLLTSATSMLVDSPSFHVTVGPDYVLQRPNAGKGWEASRYRFLPLTDPQDASRSLKFSGSRLSDRERVLKAMADQLLRGGNLSEVESALRSNDVVEGLGRKAAFVVNSYEQCLLLYEHISANFPAWRRRVRYLVRANHSGTVHSNALTASEVENLGKDQEWDLLIFPMNAIGRGVNIVYQFGARLNKAMLGSLFFLTRPHPRGDSLQLIQGLVGRQSEVFDTKRFVSTPEALNALRKAKREAAATIEYLLRLPLAVQALGEYARPFVADQMIIILQTIGRAMRGDCPAFVYFVDSAWAPRSARGTADSAKTSMLVMMQSILKECLSHQDPSIRECYESLYQSFYMPLSSIENLETSDESSVRQ
ncbi:hypothetical protein [Cupriavidus sp. amp6]|uniref:hypothetical protein n=1 Tax=Cupriavidus sp. amp6 TaxID=388051 RepID=UPI00040C675A|nr:hypothetical protein [Cupriavidus sp. amp6]